jgi:hypothetical protein
VYISGIGCSFLLVEIFWLGSRDYSQAVDVGTLGRGIKLGTIRVLVWVMGFMAHGYATDEFEVCPFDPWCRALRNIDSDDVGIWFNKSDGLVRLIRLSFDTPEDLSIIISLRMFQIVADDRSPTRDSAFIDLRNISVSTFLLILLIQIIPATTLIMKTQGSLILVSVALWTPYHQSSSPS